MRTVSGGSSIMCALLMSGLLGSTAEPQEQREKHDTWLPHVDGPSSRGSKPQASNIQRGAQGGTATDVIRPRLMATAVHYQCQWTKLKGLPPAISRRASIGCFIVFASLCLSIVSASLGDSFGSNKWLQYHLEDKQKCFRLIQRQK